MSILFDGGGKMPKEQDGATYFTVTELAKAAGTNRSNINYWIKIGRIKADRQGLAPKSPYMIEQKEAERVIEELKPSK